MLEQYKNCIRKWNFYSYPKWVYEAPFLNFWHVFEMPLLGYLGYIPFALELFALYHLAIGVLGRDDWREFMQVSAGEL